MNPGSLGRGNPKRPSHISREEVQDAIRRFQADGGIIQRLPNLKPLLAFTVQTVQYRTQSGESGYWMLDESMDTI